MNRLGVSCALLLVALGAMPRALRVSLVLLEARRVRSQSALVVFHCASSSLPYFTQRPGLDSTTGLRSGRSIMFRPVRRTARSAAHRHPLTRRPRLRVPHHAAWAQAMRMHQPSRTCSAKAIPPACYSCFESRLRPQAFFESPPSALRSATHAPPDRLAASRAPCRATGRRTDLRSVRMDQARPHHPKAGIPERTAAELPRREAAWTGMTSRGEHLLGDAGVAERLPPARVRPAEYPSPLTVGLALDPAPRPYSTASEPDASVTWATRRTSRCPRARRPPRGTTR